jgi:hypothetical protein
LTLITHPSRQAIVSTLAGSNAIDTLVEDLRRVYCGGGTMLMVKVGKLVLERLYGGDVNLWHARGRKDASFRKLAERPRLPFSRANLARAVGIYVLSLRRPDLFELQDVGPCHLREILTLEPAVQDRLLAQTTAQQWSVCRLHNEIQQLRSSDPSAHAADRLEFVALLRRWRTSVDARTLLQDAERIERLDPDEAATLLKTTKQLAQQAETLIHLLARRAGQSRCADDGRPAASPADRPSGIIPIVVSTWRQARRSARR